MNLMFYFCYNLSELNLLSFNSNNNFDMFKNFMEFLIKSNIK
jgi:hypothetical protein